MTAKSTSGPASDGTPTIRGVRDGASRPRRSASSSDSPAWCSTAPSRPNSRGDGPLWARARTAGRSAAVDRVAPSHSLRRVGQGCRGGEAVPGFARRCRRGDGRPVDDSRDPWDRRSDDGPLPARLPVWRAFGLWDRDVLRQGRPDIVLVARRPTGNDARGVRGAGKQFAGNFHAPRPRRARRARPDGCVPRVVWLPRLRDVRLRPHRRRSPFFQLRKQGLEAETAKQRAETRGQELFPSGDAMASILLGVGIGVANAAVFGLVPTYVPEAVGGASGLVGGLGAFGGFAIPPILGLFVDLQGPAGYATVSSSSSSSRSPRSASRASCTALEWCRRRTARFRPTIEPVRF